MSRVRPRPVVAAITATALLSAVWVLWLLSSALLLRSSMLRIASAGITSESVELRHRGAGGLPSAHAPLEWMRSRHQAATSLMSALFRRPIFRYGQLDMGSLTALSERERSRLAEALSGEVFSSILGAMHDAAHYPAARFERDFSRGPASDPGPMPSVASISRMMAVLSLISPSSSDSRSPAEMLGLCSSLARFGINDPTLLGWLSGASMDETAVESASVSLSSHRATRLAESSWEKLSSTWASRDASAALTLSAALETELLHSVKWVYGGLVSGSTGAADLGSTFGGESWLPLVVAYRTVLLPWAMRDMSAHIDYMLELRGLMMSQPSGAFSPPAPPPSWYPLASRMSSWFEDLPARLLSYRARLRLGRVGLALEAHRAREGAYPESLGELRLPVSALLDPFTGGNFLYHPSPSGVLVYSVGGNGSDEWGRERVRGRGDIAWRAGGTVPRASLAPSPTAVSSVR